MIAMDSVVPGGFERIKKPSKNNLVLSGIQKSTLLAQAEDGMENGRQK
jgi:hypothetical protein